MEVKNDCGSIDEYKILRQLGVGFHGQVVVAEKLAKKYAIKMYKGKTQGLENWKHQIEILKKLNHPNIVKLLEIRQNATYISETGEKSKRFIIILQHVEGGQLFYYIAVARFSEGASRTYFRILLEAIQYMHSEGIAHRDVKPQNILLDQNFDLKIIDFGFSTYLERGVLKTKCGTENYMAPEIFGKNYLGKDADYFSAGIILFLLYTGIPPFEKANQVTDQYYRALYDKKYKKFWLGHSSRLPEGYLTNDFKDLIQRMLAHNPEDRLPLEQIYNHPWMKKDSILLNEIQQQFTFRKKKIQEVRRMEIQFLKRQRCQMKKLQGKDQRSSSSPEIPCRFSKNAQIDYYSLQVCNNLGEQDFIINQTPSNFISLLEYYLTNRKKNLIAGPEELEQFFVQTNSNQKQVTVSIVNSYVDFLSNRVATIYINMFRTINKKLKLRFTKCEEGDEVLAWQLLDLVKNRFYYTP